jgi:hypothetical protein
VRLLAPFHKGVELGDKSLSKQCGSVLFSFQRITVLEKENANAFLFLGIDRCPVVAFNEHCIALNFGEDLYS